MKSLNLLSDLLQRRDTQLVAHGHKRKHTRFVSSFFATRVLAGEREKADDLLLPDLLGDCDMVLIPLSLVIESA